MQNSWKLYYVGQRPPAKPLPVCGDVCSLFMLSPLCELSLTQAKTLIVCGPFCHSSRFLPFAAPMPCVLHFCTARRLFARDELWLRASKLAVSMCHRDCIIPMKFSVFSRHAVVNLACASQLYATQLQTLAEPAHFQRLSQRPY